jgi:ATP-binding cassette subfamily B protein
MYFLKKLLRDSDLIEKVSADIIDSVKPDSSRSLIKALVLVSASAVLSSLSPMYVAKIIDVVAKSGTTLDLNILPFIGAYLLLRFGGQALESFRWLLINPVLFKVTYNLCVNVSARLSCIGHRTQSAQTNASLISEQIAIVSKIQTGATGILYGLLVVIVPTVIEFGVVVAAVGFMVGTVVILYIAFGLAILSIAIFFGRKKELARTGEAYSFDNEVFGAYGEYISNSSLIREFSADAFFKDRLESSIGRSIAAHRRLFTTKTVRGLCLTAATAAVYTGLLAWAAVKLRAGVLGAGQLFLLVAYLDRIVAPMTTASSAINTIQSGLVAMKGGYDHLDKMLAKSAFERPTVLREEALHARLSTHHVHAFADDVLHLGVGKAIRLSGPSGTGKTTHLRWLYGALLSDDAFTTLSPRPTSLRERCTKILRSDAGILTLNPYASFGRRGIALMAIRKYL